MVRNGLLSGDILEAVEQDDVATMCDLVTDAVQVGRPVAGRR